MAAPPALGPLLPPPAGPVAAGRRPAVSAALPSALPAAGPGLRARRGRSRRGARWSSRAAAGGPAGAAEPPQGGRERASGEPLATARGPGVLLGLCPRPGPGDRFADAFRVAETSVRCHRRPVSSLPLPATSRGQERGPEGERSFCGCFPFLQTIWWCLVPLAAGRLGFAVVLLSFAYFSSHLIFRVCGQ